MDDDILTEDRPGDMRGEARYMALALLAGTGAGVVGSLFHALINHIARWPHWLAGIVQGWALVVAAAGVTLACTVLAVFLARRFAPEAGGSGVHEVEGAMLGLREVRWRRVLPVKFCGGIVALSSGLVLGREGPTVHIGASIAAAVSEAFRVNELERRGLLAAGAAAGLACAFNAPVAAVLFIVEETRREFPYTFRTYLAVIFATGASTIVTQLALGGEPMLSLPAESAPMHLLPAFVLLGVVTGVAGVMLNHAVPRGLDAAAQCQRRLPYVWPAVVGVVTGMLLILLPLAVTGGDGVILGLMAAGPGLAVLLGIAALRFVTTVGCYATGAPGGIFGPILGLAACIGLAFGEALHSLVPDAGVAPLAFAIAAMGGLFTASVRAPIVGVALTAELTGSYALGLPLMVTCGAAELAAQWAGGRPLYSQLLDRTLRLASIPRAADG